MSAMTALVGERAPGVDATARATLRFLRTPKGLLLLALGGLACLAAPFVGVGQALANVLSAMLVAAVADLALTAWTRDDWAFPSGALLTGLIIALVISPAEISAVPALTSAIAVASKHLFRVRRWNVFNPAALGLVVSYFLFGSGESWWGALPDLPPATIVILLALGVYIANRVNKLPLALAFLGSFYGLATLTAFVGGSALVAELFRVPDVNALLFLALFMLDDPPTSPARSRDQVTFGLIAAGASYALFMVLGAVYFLPAGALFANAWETLRRLRS